MTELYNFQLEYEKLCRVKPDELLNVITNLGPLLKKIKGLGIETKFNFYLIKNNHNIMDEKGFLEFLTKYIPAYVLPEAAFQKINPNNLLQRYRESVGKFVRSNENTGEFGELFLYCMLEGQEKAVQLVNKMRLKTSPNMHFHGADGLHFKKDNERNILYIGESKIKKDFVQGSKKAFESLEALDEDIKKKNFEVSLIRENMNDYIPEELKNEIISHLDPWSENKVNFEERYVVFLGFSHQEIENMEKKFKGQELSEELKKYFQDVFNEKISQLLSSIKGNKLLNKKSFDFFIMPFKDTDKAKKMFLELLNG